MTANPGSEADEMWPFNNSLPPCPRCKAREIDGQYQGGDSDQKFFKVWCSKCGLSVRARTRDKSIKKWLVAETETVQVPKPRGSIPKMQRPIGEAIHGPLHGETRKPGRCSPEQITVDVNEAVRRHGLGPDKPDAGKDRWELLPWGAVRQVVKAFTAGAAQCGDFGWRTLPNARERYRGALHRHYVKRFHDGEKLDSESGLPHLAHMGACVLILLALDLEKPNKEKS